MGNIRAMDTSIVQPEASLTNLAQGSQTAEFYPLEPAKLYQTQSGSSYQLAPQLQMATTSDDGQTHEGDQQRSSPTTKHKGEHIIVQHDYHDHLYDRRTDYEEEHPARGGVSTPFPLKLHEMLENVQSDGYEEIVSWQPHGRCFVVHKPKEFVELLPSYFKLSKLASFQRQLNLYGFQRLTRGRDRGGYYHELFLRGMGFLAHSIQRIKVKGTGVRARSNPEQEPDFWRMAWIPGSTDKVTSCYVSRTPSPPKYSGISNKMLSFPSSSAQPTPNFLASSMVPMVSPASTESSKPAKYQGSDNNDSVYNQCSISSFVDEDIICAFGNKTFHYLDPFQPLSLSRQEREELNENHLQQEQRISVMCTVDQDELLNAEAESFFEDFEFPENVGAEIEDDIVFGEMLESLIR